eukprot:1078929-Prymnesium_polylepis.1
MHRHRLRNTFHPHVARGGSKPRRVVALDAMDDPAWVCLLSPDSAARRRRPRVAHSGPPSSRACARHGVGGASQGPLTACTRRVAQGGARATGSGSVHAKGARARVPPR